MTVGMTRFGCFFFFSLLGVPCAPGCRALPPGLLLPCGREQNRGSPVCCMRSGLLSARCREPR